MVTESRKGAAAWLLVPLVALAGWALYSLVEGDPEEEAVAAQRALPDGERGIRFAWPVPSVVEVTELETTIVPVAQSVEYKYTVELRETGAAGRLVVRKRDFEVMKIDGLEVADDDAFGNLTAPLELRKMSPDIYINPNGDVQDVEPWTPFFERVEQRMNELVNARMISPEHMQSVRSEMRDPQTQQNIRNASVGFWTLWVNGWLELDFNERAEIEVPGVFMLPDGELDAPQILRHEGQVVDDPEFVRLSARRSAGGPRVTDAVRAGFRDGGTRARITAAEIVATSWVELLPATMQPIRAESETRHVITSESFQIPDRVTGQKYVFDWKQ